MYFIGVQSFPGALIGASRSQSEPQAGFRHPGCDSPNNFRKSSTLNAVLLQPLPYPNAHDLSAIQTTLTDGRVATGRVAPSELVRLNDPALSIERAAGVLPQEVTLLREDGTPIRTQVYGVSEGFFELFGLPMAVGPGFTPEQFAANGPPVTVISHRIWQDMYGGDPAVVGRSVRFAEVTSTIAGVAPKGFDVPRGADFWFGLRTPAGARVRQRHQSAARPGCGAVA